MTKEGGGNTPLHNACRYGHINIAVYLLSEAHCNPLCWNNDGDTPLHSACRYGHINIAVYLLSEAHCNPLCENNDGETPLHLASADHSRAHFVQYLLSTGMDPLAKDKNGKTPMIKQEYIYGSLKLFRWGGVAAYFGSPGSSPWLDGRHH